MSYAHPEFLISTSELAAKIGDQSLRIFDTSVLLHHDDGGLRHHGATKRMCQKFVRIDRLSSRQVHLY